MKSKLPLIIFSVVIIASGVLFLTNKSNLDLVPLLGPSPTQAPTTIPNNQISPALTKSPTSEPDTSASEPDTSAEELPPSPTPHPQIRLSSPQHGAEVSSPLAVEGEARGTWFNEGVFSVILTDWDGKIIAESSAQAEGEWMSEDFVPFTAELEFDKPDLYNRGHLILQKANPSGLPENDDAWEITVFFE